LDAAVRRSILSGFPERVGKRRRPGQPDIVLSQGGSAKLSPTSVVHEGEKVSSPEVAGGHAGDGEGIERVRVVSEIVGLELQEQPRQVVHIAVRCPKEIGLPLVAEIMNAKDHQDAIDLSTSAETDGSKVIIKGAWRIWNEHGGDQNFTQGKAVARSENTNPDHVFEIHPITEFGPHDVRTAFKPIEGFDPKKAEDAFHRYENTRSKIVPGKTTTKVISAGLGYNYVEFQMELMEKAFPVADGSLAYAKVRDWDGELVLRKKRMVFMKDTPARGCCARQACGRLLAGAWNSAARLGTSFLAREKRQGEPRSPYVEPAVRNYCCRSVRQSLLG
jgi:hypothetical protein